MIDWTEPTSLAARAGITAYTSRHTIQKFWVKAKALLDKGKTQILITGMPSAGKTMLLGQMHGRARDLYFKVPGQSTKVEVEAVTLDAWTKLVRVLPGQVTLRTVGEINAYQENDCLEGIIHVVDYGFSIPRDPVIANSLLTVDSVTSIDDLRSRNMKLEIAALKVELDSIRRLLAVAQKPKWLVIAVNKVDLFSDDRLNALSHYHPDGISEFSEVLREFRASVGSANIAIHACQVCAYQSKFSWGGQEIRPLLEHTEQDQMLRDFITIISILSDGAA